MILNFFTVIADSPQLSMVKEKAFSTLWNILTILHMYASRRECTVQYPLWYCFLSRSLHLVSSSQVISCISPSSCERVGFLFNSTCTTNLLIFFLWQVLRKNKKAGLSSRRATAKDRQLKGVLFVLELFNDYMKTLIS